MFEKGNLGMGNFWQFGDGSQIAKREKREPSPNFQKGRKK